jgi:hypothetical protein
VPSCSDTLAFIAAVVFGTKTLDLRRSPHFFDDPSLAILRPESEIAVVEKMRAPSAIKCLSPFRM